jgi:hypothetical protein
MRAQINGASSLSQLARRHISSKEAATRCMYAPISAHLRGVFRVRCPAAASSGENNPADVALPDPCPVSQSYPLSCRFG